MTTKWFSGDTKPTMSGVYQIQSNDSLSVFWAYWDADNEWWCVFSTTKRHALLRNDEVSAIQRKRWRGLEQEEFIEQVRNFRDEHSEFYVYIKSSFGGGWQLLYDDMHRVDEALRYYDGAVMSYSGHDVKLIKAPKGERHLYIIYEQKIRAANCTDG